MNPPLRSDDHRLALIEAIKDGTIDVIATDHAPHHMDEKRVEFDLAPFGVTGLETAFSVCNEVLVKARHIGIDRLIDLMSCAPARIFGLPGGTLLEGSPADVTIVNLDAESSFGTFRSLAGNSPFRGKTFRGRVVATIVDGKVRYTDIAMPEKKTGKTSPRKKRAKK